MKKLKILITIRPDPPIYEQLLRDDSLEIILVKEPVGGHGIVSGNWSAEWLRECDVMFTSGVLPANIANASHLKWVQLGSAGYEEAIKAGLASRAIRVSNALGVFDIAIAEWNICMLIALSRNLRGMIRNQENATWNRDARFQRELRGSIVGFWGYGGLSRETAHLCKALGLKVHVLVRNGIKQRHHFLVEGTGDPQGVLPDRVFNMNAKGEFLSSLDFLIVAMPQTPASIGSIGENELRLLKRSAYVLNPARTAHP